MLKILFSTVLIAGMGVAIAWTAPNSSGVSMARHHGQAPQVIARSR